MGLPRGESGTVSRVARLHLGLILPNYGELLDAERLAVAAVAAEEAGFDSGWVTDHLLVPQEHAKVYGTIAEPLVALKQLTTLDFLSSGRLVTAVAAGWMEGEFATLGASFEERGRLLDEWLDAVAASFDQMPGLVRWHGKLLSFEGWLAPALVRPGGPELWVAGVSRATLRRAAKTGVWHPVALPVDELRPMAAALRERRPDARVVLRIGVSFAPEPYPGRDERGRHAIAGPADWIAERLVEYAEAGCDGFVVNLEHERPGLDERILRFAEDVRPRMST